MPAGRTRVGGPHLLVERREPGSGAGATRGGQALPDLHCIIITPKLEHGIQRKTASAALQATAEAVALRFLNNFIFTVISDVPKRKQCN